MTKKNYKDLIDIKTYTRDDLEEIIVDGIAAAILIKRELVDRSSQLHDKARAARVEAKGKAHDVKAKASSYKMSAKRKGVAVGTGLAVLGLVAACKRAMDKELKQAEPVAHAADLEEIEVVDVVE